MSASQSGAFSSAQKGESQGASVLRGIARARGVAVAGVVLSGLVGGALLFDRPAGVGQLGAAEIASVAADDLSSARTTLDPARAAALASDARACKAPLAYVTLSQAPGSPDSDIRIRSGDYVSPIYHIGAAPIRVAIPFPTPYATGRGQIFVEGRQLGLDVTLYPTMRPGGGGVINIWWTTDKPCGG